MADGDCNGVSWTAPQPKSAAEGTFSFVRVPRGTDMDYPKGFLAHLMRRLCDVKGEG